MPQLCSLDVIVSILAQFFQSLFQICAFAAVSFLESQLADFLADRCGQASARNIDTRIVTQHLSLSLSCVLVCRFYCQINLCMDANVLRSLSCFPVVHVRN